MLYVFRKMKENEFVNALNKHISNVAKKAGINKDMTPEEFYVLMEKTMNGLKDTKAKIIIMVKMENKLNSEEINEAEECFDVISTAFDSLSQPKTSTGYMKDHLKTILLTIYGSLVEYPDAIEKIHAATVKIAALEMTEKITK